MRIISNRNINLHTAPLDPTAGQLDGGLVHCPAGQTVTVPDSAKNHPSFKLLLNDGIISVLADLGKPAPAAKAVKDSTKDEPPIKPLDDDDEVETKGTSAPAGTTEVKK
jgi:hypothetical protein